jgi:hypothetical protein
MEMALNHRHMLGLVQLALQIKDPSIMRRFLFALPSALGMKILSPPVVDYCSDPGNGGLSGFC